jgi:hypothetical protein
MKRIVLLVIIAALAFVLSGCPVEPEYYEESFTGTVSLLDSADSLLSSAMVKYRVINYNDTLYTYETNCDSTGYFDIYVGKQRNESILYLEFSCDGYAVQAYPVSTLNGQIGNIILVPQ